MLGKASATRWCLIPGQNEDDEIRDIVLEEMGLRLIVRAQDERRKYDNMVVQYENAMIFLRELLNAMLRLARASVVYRT